MFFHEIFGHNSVISLFGTMYSSGFGRLYFRAGPYGGYCDDTTTGGASGGARSDARGGGPIYLCHARSSRTTKTEYELESEQSVSS